ncbi:MAG: hypothetical protein ACR2LS_02545 [Thermomicrobiales bacterium]
MKRGTARTRLGRSVLTGVVALMLASCGDDAPEPAPANTVPAATVPVVATATLGALASPPALVTAPSTPLPASTVVAATPPADQDFISESAELGPIQWTAMVDPTTLAPVQPVQAFPTTAATIYAVVPVRRINAGTVVSATWTYNDTAIEGVTSSVTVPDAVADVWLEFHLARTTVPEWPDGTYSIIVQVGGQPALASSVVVDNT